MRDRTLIRRLASSLSIIFSVYGVLSSRLPERNKKSHFYFIDLPSPKRRRILITRIIFPSVVDIWSERGKRARDS